MFSSSIEFDTSIILQNVGSKSITCYWCRKIASASNGQRSLAEIAEILYLPLPVARKLLLKGLNFGWFVVNPAVAGVAEQTAEQVGQGQGLWQEVQEILSRALGEHSGKLLQDAARMTKQEAGRLSLAGLPHFLIALELLLGEQDRLALLPALDGLRLRHSAA